MGVIKSYVEELTLDETQMKKLKHLVGVSSEVCTLFSQYDLDHLPLIVAMQKDICKSLGYVAGSSEEKIAYMEVEALHWECSMSRSMPYPKSNRLRFMHPQIDKGMLIVANDLKIKLSTPNIENVVRGSIYSDKNQKWFLSLEVEHHLASSKEHILGVTVIDIDHRDYMFDSDGTIFHNTTNYDNIVTRYLNLSRNANHSSCTGCKTELKNLESRVSNIRIDVYHKIAKQYALSGNLILAESKQRPSLKAFVANKSMYCCNGFLKLLELKCKETGTPFYTVTPEHVDSLICSKYNIPYESLDTFTRKYPWCRMQTLYELGASLVSKLNRESEDETTGICKTDKFSELG